MATEIDQKAKAKVQLPRVLILVIVMPWLLLMVGFGFFLLGQKMFKGNGSSGNVSKEAVQKPGVAYPLKEFVVNLADKSTDHHLKVSIVLQLTSGTTDSDIKLYEPKIRYVILANLRSKQVKDLNVPNGLEGLRYKLKSVINQVVPGNKVYDVLITDCLYD